MIGGGHGRGTTGRKTVLKEQTRPEGWTKTSNAIGDMRCVDTQGLLPSQLWGSELGIDYRERTQIQDYF